jgi:hypothetical protein
MFLTVDSDLASYHQWATMLPPTATVLETTTRFSMQLLGRESSVVDPVSAAQPTNKGGDFMRALKEQAQVGQPAWALQIPRQCCASNESHTARVTFGCCADLPVFSMLTCCAADTLLPCPAVHARCGL